MLLEHIQNAEIRKGLQVKTWFIPLCIMGLALFGGWAVVSFGGCCCQFHGNTAACMD